MVSRDDAPSRATADGVRYRCAVCGETFCLDHPRWSCPCGKGSHLDLTSGPGLSAADIDTGRQSMWRYRAALPIKESPGVSLGEGWTPLVDGRWDGHRVLYKLEFLMPTGSFKDRGTALLVNYLSQRGVNAVLNDSSGNAGASLAAYAAAARMTCRILVPASTSPSKLIQIAATGVEVVAITGSRQDVAEAALRQAEESFYASHNRHPLFLEGVKTLGYEIWEALGFRVPDNIVVPLGGGSIMLGCYLAFSELGRRGEVDRLPRLFGVQAAACAPIHATFVAGADELVPAPTVATVAEGIVATRPVRFREVLAALRTTKGRTVAVTEAQILAALRGLAEQGLFVEPTSAAAAAGLTQLYKDGTVADRESTVLVLTGSGLKAADTIGKVLGLAAEAQRH